MIEFPDLDLVAPDGAIIAVIEEGPSRLIPSGKIPAHLIHPFATADPLTKARGISALLDRRRRGDPIVLISYDEPLLERCADEIWWLRDGALVARGDPAELLPAWRRHIAAQLRAAAEGNPAPIAPATRDGDGRAVLEAIELLGHTGQPSAVWMSGEQVSIAVTVRYLQPIENPVVGVLIRTRIGLNVYGTNTELESIEFGPVQPGQTVRVTCRFRCDLCPGDYTVTAASHDPDGLWHDWQEDAVAFAVADTRYTAGVANLRGAMTVTVAQ